MCTTATSQNPMLTLDLNQLILDEDNQPMQVEPPFDVRKVVRLLINGAAQLDAVSKAILAGVAMRTTRDYDTVEVGGEAAKLLAAQAGAMLSPVAMMRAYEFLGVPLPEKKSE